MLKKFFLSVLVVFMSMFAFLVPSQQVSAQVGEMKILEWNKFNKTPDGNQINCAEYANLKLDNVKDDGSGKDKIVKGCIMEKKVNDFARYFIFLSIVAVLCYMILQVVKKLFSSEGQSGGMGGGGDDWSVLKTPAIGLFILTVILVGGLNLVLELFMFIIKLFV